MIARNEMPMCRWCGERLSRSSRKFCSLDCRDAARRQEMEDRDPSPAEIREICRQIREEGGPEWERSRACYPPEPASVPVVRIARESLP